MGHAAMDTIDKKAYATSGMMWGLLIGVAAGLLLAPQSGRESRIKLQRKVDDMKDKARQKQSEIQDKVGEQADKLGDKAEQISSRNRNNTAM